MEKDSDMIKEYLQNSRQIPVGKAAVSTIKKFLE